MVNLMKCFATHPSLSMATTGSYGNIVIITRTLDANRASDETKKMGGPSFDTKNYHGKRRCAAC